MSRSKYYRLLKRARLKIKITTKFYIISLKMVISSKGSKIHAQFANVKFTGKRIGFEIR